MLIARKMQELNFSALMGVYIEGNTESGQELYPDRSPFEQLRLAEEDFYRYLTEDFFRQKDALYFVLTEGNIYVSALRVEPYQDGLLLQALETCPDMRRRGYAKRLMTDAIQYLKNNGYKKVYSHVSASNQPSLKTHYGCGFKKKSDHAVYLDGTVSANAFTLWVEL